MSFASLRSATFDERNKFSSLFTREGDWQRLLLFILIVQTAAHLGPIPLFLCILEKRDSLLKSGCLSYLRCSLSDLAPQNPFESTFMTLCQAWLEGNLPRSRRELEERVHRSFRYDWDVYMPWITLLSFLPRRSCRDCVSMLHSSSGIVS